jgi:hypothetical protein
MPRKEFESFTRLDASDVNTYLMDQSVMTFGGTAARGSAITTPAEGMVTYLEDSNSLQLYDGSGWTAAGGVSSGNFFINGAMQVAQRGTATTGVTTSGYYTADRWQVGPATMGTFTITVEDDGPTGSGLTKSLKMLCTTADASPAAGDNITAIQRLEGQNVQAIKKGTASAEQLTLSFWVKANVTGTYIANLFDSTNNRSVSAPYSVSTSGTWEKKTITFPADTTGELANNNLAQFRLQLWLGAGSNFTTGTLNTTWESTNNVNRAVGQVNLASAINNYWQITGVQLELGNVASDFDFQDFGTELAACQRYYQRFTLGSAFDFFPANGYVATATNAFQVIRLTNTMRIAPTSIDFGGSIAIKDMANAGFAVSSIALGSGNKDTANITSVSSGMTTSRWATLQANSDANAFIGFSSEL